MQISTAYITDALGNPKRISLGYLGNLEFFQNQDTPIISAPVNVGPYGTLDIDDPYGVSNNIWKNPTQNYINTVQQSYKLSTSFKYLLEDLDSEVFNLQNGAEIDWNNSQASWINDLQGDDRRLILTCHVERFNKTNWINNVKWFVKELTAGVPDGLVAGIIPTQNTDLESNYQNLFTVGEDTSNISTALSRLVDSQAAVWQETRSGPYVYTTEPYPIFVLSHSLSSCNTIRATGQRFTIRDLITYSNNGATILDYCDAVAVQYNYMTSTIQNFDGTYPQGQSIHHVWQAIDDAAEFNLSRRRPVVINRCAYKYTGLNSYEGAYLNKFLLESFKIGLALCWHLYWGITMSLYSAVAGAQDDAENLMGSDLDPQTRNPLMQTLLDQWDWNKYDINNFPHFNFPGKSWIDFHRGDTWAVHFAINNSPTGSGIPFPEWNRVQFHDNMVTLSPGGRNTLFRPVLLRDRSTHVFRVEVLASTGATVKLEARGYDKLNGLNFVSQEFTQTSDTPEWIELSVSFTPVSHGRQYLPDSPSVLLVIDHDGVGTVDVREPHFASGDDQWIRSRGFVETTVRYSADQMVDWFATVVRARPDVVWTHTETGETWDATTDWIGEPVWATNAIWIPMIDFTSLDEYINDLDVVGARIIIDPHTFPGFAEYESTRADDPFWTNLQYHANAALYWSQVAEHYKDYEGVILGYELLSGVNIPNTGTPVQTSGSTSWIAFCERCRNAIRAHDNKHALIVEQCSRGGHEMGDYVSALDDYENAFVLDDPNVVHSIRFYEPFEYQRDISTDYVYPGCVINDEVINSTWLADKLAPVRQFQIDSGLDVFVSEFGTLPFTGELETPRQGAVQFDTDIISIFERYGWSWCRHTVGDTSQSVNQRMDLFEIYTENFWRRNKFGNTLTILPPGARTDLDGGTATTVSVAETDGGTAVTTATIDVDGGSAT